MQAKALKRLLDAWGEWHFAHENDITLYSDTPYVALENSVNSASVQKSRPLYRDAPAFIAVIDDALIGKPLKMRHALRAKYICRESVNYYTQSLGMCQRSYYKWLNSAHSYLMVTIC